ncbi:MAG: hypothetical protein LBE37_01530 [Sphingobacterium sp.]|nr:hypothetical protein [Sphingobacterium sp.]
MNKRRILIFSGLVSLMLVVNYAIPFRDLVIPAWNTLIVPAELIRQLILCMLLLVLMGCAFFWGLRYFEKKNDKYRGM